MSLLWSLDSQWEVEFRVNLQDFNDGAVRSVSLLSNDIYQTQSGDPGSIDQDVNSQALKISYQNQKFEMLSVTARRESETAYTADFDFLPQSIFHQKTQPLFQQWSQEFRIKSLDESVWRWSMGLFFSTNEVSGNQSNIILGFPDNLDIQTLDETSYAAFGQLSYQGFDAFRVFFDLRLDFVEKQIKRSHTNILGQTTQLNAENDVFFASPKLTLEYALFSQLSSYFSTGLSFKPGGFSAQSNVFPQYAKETMWHNEVGLKSTWMDKRFTANLALFYYEIENYQLEEFFTPIDYTVVNAPEVTSYGAEFSFSAVISDTFQLNGSFAYLQTEFNTYRDPFTGANYQDNKVPFVPEFNANIAGIFIHPSGFYARLDLVWTGKTYFNAANTASLSEQDYTLLNAFLGYQYKYFSINVYAKNLLESEYFTFKEERLNVGTPGEPLVFGANIKFEF